MSQDHLHAHPKFIVFLMHARHEIIASSSKARAVAAMMLLPALCCTMTEQLILSLYNLSQVPVKGQMRHVLALCCNPFQGRVSKLSSHRCVNVMYSTMSTHTPSMLVDITEMLISGTPM